MAEHHLDRRTFIGTSLASAAVCASGLLLRGAEPAPPVILGQGDYRYQCINDWGKLPPQIIYGLTHGVAVDSRGFVHVLHTSRNTSPSHDTVVVFDRDGNFVRSWGEEFFGSAHGFDLIVENGHELFYITDMKRGLFKTTLDGKTIWHVEKPPFYDGKTIKYIPTNVAVAPNGDVYLADGYGSWYIHHFDRDGNYKKTFGGPDGAIDQPSPSATIHPHGLHVDVRGKEPLLVIAENDPKGKLPGRLHAFDLDGTHHSYLPTNVRSPRHFDRLGKLVVVPDLDAVVTLIDEDNRVVAELGDGWTTHDEVRALRKMPRDHFTPGKFVCPHDAAFDKDGSIFVSEWVEAGRVTKLQKV
jgi:hypothetical protein